MNDPVLSRGEQTRLAIIQAAHELFLQQGFHGTSMRQISERAGLALGGLYNHFASKEEVFKEVFFAYHPYHQVIPALKESRHLPIEPFAHHAIRRMIAALQEHPDFLNLLFIEFVEFQNIHTRELFAKLMPEIAQIVQGVITTSQDQLRPIPPLIIMRSYFGLFFAFFLTEYLFAEQAPAEFREGAVDYFVEIFLHGVLRQDSENGRS